MAALRKRPFDIDVAVRRLRRAVKPFPKAALFELADDGFDSVFEQLVACIISIRTYDETTLPVARKLFAAARTPRDVALMSPREIDRLIGACTFHAAKAKQIHDAAAERQIDGRRWLSLEGPATVTDDPARVAAAVEGYAGRYRQPGEREDRVAIEIRVDRIIGRP